MLVDRTGGGSVNEKKVLTVGTYYDIIVELVDSGGLASCKLEWESQSVVRKIIQTNFLFPEWEQVGATYPVQVTHFPPSMSSIMTYTKVAPLGTTATLTIQSVDSSGIAFYEATYIYTLTYTGPTSGSIAPTHLANGLYSAYF